MDENEKNGHMKKVTKKNILNEFVKKYYQKVDEKRSQEW